MAVYGRLGAVDAKLPGVAYAVYTLPTTAPNAYTTLDLNVCNRGNDYANLYIYLQNIAGDQIPIELSVDVNPKDVFLRTSIMISPGDTLYVQAVTGTNLSYVAYGMQDLYDTIDSVPLPVLSIEGATAPPNVLSNAEFGSTTYANNTTYMISATDVVYVYDAITNSLTSTLNALVPGENFGKSISASSFFWAIGAPAATITSGNAAGAVYIYNSLSGELITRLESLADVPGAEFGTSIDMNDDYLVVSAPAAGVVFVFDTATLALLYTFTPSGTSTKFGNSVRISGSFVAIGDPSQNLVDTYSASSGVQGTTLTSPVSNIDFGHDIDVRNGYIVVGAPALDYNDVTDGGGAYLYTTAGVLIGALTSPEAQTVNDYLGWSVAIANDFVLVGSPYIDLGTTIDEGKVYAYTFDAEFAATYAI
jgi:hypothetical protein